MINWLDRLMLRGLARWRLGTREPIARDDLERAAEAIATLMHDALCTNEHTEGCGWKYDEGHAADPASFYYQPNIWDMDCHAVWKRRALRALATAYHADEEFPGTGLIR